jgi:DNA-binding phage protein
METTDREDVSTSAQDATVRLRVAVYDALALSKGYTKVEAQASWHGIARSTLFRLRGGGVPEMATAMRMASDLGVPVEVIWERVA